MLNSNRHCKYEWSAYICWYWSPVGQEHKGPAVEESTLKKQKKVMSQYSFLPGESLLDF